MMVGLLKQVLSIQDIAVLFSGDEDAERLYNCLLYTSRCV